jgi:hypothetical protein
MINVHPGAVGAVPDAGVLQHSRREIRDPAAEYHSDGTDWRGQTVLRQVREQWK